MARKTKPARREGRIRPRGRARRDATEPLKNGRASAGWAMSADGKSRCTAAVASSPPASRSCGLPAILDFNFPRRDRLDRRARARPATSERGRARRETKASRNRLGRGCTARATDGKSFLPTPMRGFDYWARRFEWLGRWCDGVEWVVYEADGIGVA